MKCKFWVGKKANNLIIQGQKGNSGHSNLQLKTWCDDILPREYTGGAGGELDKTREFAVQTVLKWKIQKDCSTDSVELEGI